MLGLCCLGYGGIVMLLSDLLPDYNFVWKWLLLAFLIGLYLDLVFYFSVYMWKWPRFMCYQYIGDKKATKN